MNKPQTCLDCGNAAIVELFGCWFCHKCAHAPLVGSDNAAAKLRVVMAGKPDSMQLARRMFYQDGKVR